MCDRLIGLKEELQRECDGLNKKIDNQFDFIESEIEIIIESFKIKLEETEQKLKNQLHERKDGMKDFINQRAITNSVNNATVSNSSITNEDLFDIYNKELIKIKTVDFKFQFNENDQSYELINEKFIGNFYCTFDSLANRIDECAPLEYVQLDFEPYHVLELKNGNILITSVSDSYLRIYNENFDIILKTNLINGKEITSKTRATTDLHTGHVYLSIDHTIFKLDSSLNYIDLKPYPYNNRYSDIWVCGNFLYVCERNSPSKFIETLSLDLKLISKNYFKYAAYQIRILNNIACVLHDDEGLNYKTYFYKLPSFEPLFVYDFYGSTFIHSQYFYIYQDDGLNVFTDSGKFIEKKTTNYSDKLKYATSGVAVIKNSIFICFDNQKLGKISLK